nr:radical SAM protein [Ensifer sp. ENS04]
MTCDWCYIPFGRPAPSSAVSHAVLRRLLQFGVTELTIGGGDPSTYRFWFDLMSEAKRAGVFVHVDTNGIGLRLDDETARALVSDVDLLGLPLDGADSKTHGLMRGNPGHFDLILARIRWASGLGVPIKINTIVTKQNCGSLSQLGELIGSLKPAIWSIYEYWPLSPGGANQAHWEVDGMVFQDAVSKLPNFTEGTRIEVNSRHARQLTYPIVAHDGSVYMHSREDINSFEQFGSVFVDGILDLAFEVCKGDREIAQRRYRALV